jgi:hypothetical protein
MSFDHVTGVALNFSARTESTFMDEIIGFKDLKAGQWVSAKGKMADHRTFTALEVELQFSKAQAEIEGLIQNIDLRNNTLQILNRQYALPHNAVIKALDGKTAGLQELKPMTLARLMGKYSAASGFIPQTIKIKRTKDFNIEKLKGAIERIDPEKKTLQLLGFTVTLSQKTIIELF